MDGAYCLYHIPVTGTGTGTATATAITDIQTSAVTATENWTSPRARASIIAA